MVSNSLVIGISMVSFVVVIIVFVEMDVVFRMVLVVVLTMVFVVVFTMVLVAILVTTVEIIEVVSNHSKCNVRSNVCLIIRFLSLVILVVVVKYLWLQMQCKGVLVCSVIFVERLDI